LEEEEFQYVIKGEWKKFDAGMGTPTCVYMENNLKSIKAKVVDGAAKRYKARDRILKEAEDELDTLYHNNASIFFSEEERLRVKELEEK
jgi:hypothetical protein